ncbi:hypothetical protein [Arenimonas sp.]|uniref:hypothetical protein n=1 Tax=Arenimonas sp. TaxID=1872635 RepID=UPI0039E31BE0
MKKPILLILILVLVIAVTGSLLLYRQAQTRWSKDSYDEEYAALQAEAAKKEGMPRSDALREAGLAMTAKKLKAAEGADAKALAAAETFFGFLYMNTKARVAWCRERGVDISHFADVFTEHNAVELARAEAVFAANGADSRSLWAMSQDGMLDIVAVDMQDVATSNGIPLEGTCAFFNEHADQIAPHIAFPVDVKEALMTGGK